MKHVSWVFELLLTWGLSFLSVFGDSALVISQIKGEWDTKHLNLIPYRGYVLTLLPHFEEVTFEHFPREENQVADTLATMSYMFKVSWDNEAPQITIEKLENPHTAVRSTPKKWQTNLGFTKSKGISRFRSIPKGHLSTIRSFWEGLQRSSSLATTSCISETMIRP